MSENFTSLKKLREKKFVLDINDSEFKTKFPLHYKAIKIINSEEKISPFLAFFEGIKSPDSAFATKNFPYSKDGEKKAYFISITKERLETSTLLDFISEYYHEMHHIKSMKKYKIFSNEEITQSLTEIYNKNVINIFTRLSIVPIAIWKSIKHGNPETVALRTATLYASTCLLDYGILKARDYFYHKMEYNSDLYQYNKTGNLPTNSFKLYYEDLKDAGKELIESFDKERKDGVISRLVKVTAHAIGKYFLPLGNSQGKHPEDEKRDEYCIKYGNPKPNPMIMKLIKMDEAKMGDLIKI